MDINQVDAREVGLLVRDAIAYKQAVEAGRDPKKRRPLFIELEEHLKAVLDGAEALYYVLPVFGTLWKVHGVDLILNAMADPNAPPLGQGTVTVAQWRAYQRLFHALQLFMETAISLPDDPEGTTPGPVPLPIILQRSVTPEATPEEQP